MVPKAPRDHFRNPKTKSRLERSAFWSVLPNFGVQIDPWSFSAIICLKPPAARNNFFSCLVIFDMTPLPEFDLLAGSNLANPLQREPGFFTGINIGHYLRF